MCPSPYSQPALAVLPLHFIPLLARATSASDLSMSSLSSGLDCKSSHVAHSPCHSYLTPLCVTWAVYANRIGCAIHDMHYVRNSRSVLEQVLQPETQIPCSSFQAGSVLCNPGILLPPWLIPALRNKAPAISRSSCEANSVNIVP